MDQEFGAGHPLITAEATSHIFQKLAVNGKVMGLSEDKFYKCLNDGQSFADRSPAGRIENTPFGLGDTWMPTWLSSGAQARHSMADPDLTGGENLRGIRDFVNKCLMNAHSAHIEGNSADEWQWLGAAAHALEDSYSSAHAFRDPSNPEDPHAAIQAFNTFNWFGDGDTHDEGFDSVPVQGDNLVRGTDKAAANAVAELFGVYVKTLGVPDQDASTAYSGLTRSLLHGSDIKVFKDRLDPEYVAQRIAHYRNDASGAGPDPAPAKKNESAPEDDPNAAEKRQSLPEDGQASSTNGRGESKDDAVSDEKNQSVPEDTSTGGGFLSSVLGLFGIGEGVGRSAASDSSEGSDTERDEQQQQAEERDATQQQQYQAEQQERDEQQRQAEERDVAQQQQYQAEQQERNEQQGQEQEDQQRQEQEDQQRQEQEDQQRQEQEEQQRQEQEEQQQEEAREQEQQEQMREEQMEEQQRESQMNRPFP